ncbi:MAG: transglutaminase family protein [SAR324 cluster bacterium]|nr:transglutaminase family protein [SAR324 cluster bacterium]
MKEYSITHTTVYQYEKDVTLCHNEAHLSPRPLPHQQCLSTTLNIIPTPEVYEEREDIFGNRVAYFALQRPHHKLEVTAQSVLLIENRELPQLQDSLPWEKATTLMQEQPSEEMLDVRYFTFPSPKIQTFSALKDYTLASFSSNRPLLEAVMDLTSRIYHDFTFDPKATNVTTAIETVFEKKRGVCQDFAHLAIGGLRSIGLAARYVSGYLETLPPPGKPKLVGSDVSHAWISVYCPYYGWIDFDPTNNVIPQNQHMVVAWGRDYSDITPLKGILFGGGKKHTLKVSVDVRNREDISTPQSVPV